MARMRDSRPWYIASCVPAIHGGAIDHTVSVKSATCFTSKQFSATRLDVHPVLGSLRAFARDGRGVDVDDDERLVLRDDAAALRVHPMQERLRLLSHACHALQRARAGVHAADGPRGAAAVGVDAGHTLLRMQAPRRVFSAEGGHATVAVLRASGHAAGVWAGRVQARPVRLGPRPLTRVRLKEKNESQPSVTAIDESRSDFEIVVSAAADEWEFELARARESGLWHRPTKRCLLGEAPCRQTILASRLSRKRRSDPCCLTIDLSPLMFHVTSFMGIHASSGQSRATTGVRLVLVALLLNVASHSCRSTLGKIWQVALLEPAAGLSGRSTPASCVTLRLN